MLPKELSAQVDLLRERFSKLEKRLADPSIYSNPDESRTVSREHQKLSKLFANFDRWSNAQQELDDNREMLNSETDEDMLALTEADIEKLQAETQKLETAVLAALLPQDPHADRNLIVEIKPAAGGEEAALFAADLYRAYLRYAEQRGWQTEIMDQTDSELGGIRNAVFSISGEEAWERMKYESGVHRVQRVPITESGGRIHTSTITVSVLPEAEDVELEIKNEDLRIDVFRSSGPGGQSVNTTDSAVRITHLPTGMIVISQQEKSQHRNKDMAMRVLRARLLDKQKAEEAAKFAADKKSQIGTGDRSERIRTYNFPQNRISDHRFGLTVHNLPRLLEGDFDFLFDEILAIDARKQLASLLKTN